MRLFPDALSKLLGSVHAKRLHSCEEHADAVKGLLQCVLCTFVRNL